MNFIESIKTCLFKKYFILITIFLSLSEISFSNERKWELVDENSIGKFLLDYSSIKKDVNNNNQVKFISLVSFNDIQSNKSVKGKYYSAQFYNKIKCDSLESAWYIAQFYDVKMDKGVTNQGNVVDSIRPFKEKWMRLDRNSPNGKINKTVCVWIATSGLREYIEKNPLTEEDLKKLRKKLEAD